MQIIYQMFLIPQMKKLEYFHIWLEVHDNRILRLEILINISLSHQRNLTFLTIRKYFRTLTMLEVEIKISSMKLDVILLTKDKPTYLTNSRILGSKTIVYVIISYIIQFFYQIHNQFTLNQEFLVTFYLIIIF